MKKLFLVTFLTSILSPMAHAVQTTVSGSQAAQIIEAFILLKVAPDQNTDPTISTYSSAMLDCWGSNSMGADPSTSDNFGLLTKTYCRTPTINDEAKAKIIIDALSASGVPPDGAGPQDQYLAQTLKCSIYRNETELNKRFSCTFDNPNQSAE